jgi:hypothetical protein
MWKQEWWKLPTKWRIKMPFFLWQKSGTTTRLPELLNRVRELKEQQVHIQNATSMDNIMELEQKQQPKKC